MLEEGRTDSEIATILNNPVSPLILQEFQTSKHAAWKDKLGPFVQDILKLEHCKGRAGTNIRAKAKDVKRTHSSVESGESKKKTKRATFEGRTDQLFEEYI